MKEISRKTREVLVGLVGMADLILFFAGWIAGWCSFWAFVWPSRFIDTGRFIDSPWFGVGVAIVAFVLIAISIPSLRHLCPELQVPQESQGGQ